MGKINFSPIENRKKLFLWYWEGNDSRIYGQHIDCDFQKKEDVEWIISKIIWIVKEWLVGDRGFGIGPPYQQVSKYEKAGSHQNPQKYILGSDGRNTIIEKPLLGNEQKGNRNSNMPNFGIANNAVFIMIFLFAMPVRTETIERQIHRRFLASLYCQSALRVTSVYSMKSGQIVYVVTTIEILAAEKKHWYEVRIRDQRGTSRIGPFRHLD